MYNLNYNITNCRLNRPVGRPFVPTPRFDAYSASLVVAIPGNVFKNGYVNVFNQINSFDDISAYIRQGSVLNVNTGTYYPQAATYSAEIVKDAFGTYVSESAPNNFFNEGYFSSIFFSGSVGVQLSSDANLAATRQGTNLTSASNFLIETWVAFDATASVSRSIDPFTGFVYTGTPNRILAQKYNELAPNSSSYLSYVGWGGVTNAPVAEANVVSGSALFLWDSIPATEPEPDEYYAFPQSSSISVQQPKKWVHYAISYSTGSVPNSPGVFRYYVSGSLIGTTAWTSGGPYNMNQSSIQTILFGDNGFIDVPPASGSQNNGAYFQDFRMYNGSNKNYTASAIIPPLSMVVGQEQPYPQYG